MTWNWAAPALLALAISTLAQAQTTSVDVNGALHVAATVLPPSALLSEETRSVLRTQIEEARSTTQPASCGNIDTLTPEQAPAFRRCEVDRYERSPEYRRLNALYKVDWTPQYIGGVYTEVFVPREGVSTENRRRVLIDVHGGGFEIGSRTFSKTESIPIAGYGRIKVVSVDYRMAPEFRFPAASDDVEAVYRGLLKHYKPQQIGLFGCSAGGVLVAQSVARFIHDGLPVPGAAAMLCGAGEHWAVGDSGQLFVGRPNDSAQDNPYFRGVDRDDPLAFPVRSKELLARFPPSLLISSTRDLALSSVVDTHAKLVAQHVEADLHVWEGLGHGFFYDARLPESREAYDVIVRFFDKHLAR